MRPAARHPVFHQTALRSADPRHSWAARAPPVRRRADGRLLQELGQGRARLLHRGRAAVLLLAVRRSRRRAVRELLLLDARLDHPQPPLHDVRHLGRHHEQRLSAASGSSTRGSGRSSSTSSTRPGSRGGSTTSAASTTSSRPTTDNAAMFWSRWAHDPRTFATSEEYLQDCAAGTLPAVSWLIPSYSGAARRAPARRRVDRDAPPAAGHRARCARRRSSRARRSCSATTSTAATSTTSRRRRSTRTAWASACRSG